MDNTYAVLRGLIPDYQSEILSFIVQTHRVIS